MKNNKFTAVLAVFPRGELSGFGSSSRGPSPKKVAQTVFGDTLDGAHLFAYMFRRFGYPNVGWDDYKQLVEYAITTPISGLYLTVYPSLGHDSQFHFGCLFTNKVEDWMYGAERKRIDKHHGMLHAWAKRSLVCGKLLPGEDRPVLHEFEDKDSKPTGWVLCERRPSDPKNDRRLTSWMPKLNSNNWDYATMVVGPIYQKLHPEPPEAKAKRMAQWDKPWHKQPHNAIWRANKAFEATMRDLLRPTNVRDHYFNAAGSVDDGREDYLAVPYYEHAGIAGKLACKPEKLTKV